MGCKVPHRHYVLADKTEIESLAVDVIDLAKITILDQIADVRDSRILDKGMTNH